MINQSLFIQSSAGLKVRDLSRNWEHIFAGREAGPQGAFPPGKSPRFPLIALLRAVQNRDSVWYRSVRHDRWR